MATRGHYIFNNKTIIYNHWDNYPEGAAILLNRMLLEQSGDWAARFVRANTSAEITNGEFYGGAEYNYYIDTNTKSIKVMTVSWDDKTDQETETEFFTGSIYDFINEYFPKSAEVGRLPQYRQNTFIKMNTWKNGESITALKQQLITQLDDFAEYCTYSATNPNKTTKHIQKTIEQMMTLLD